MQIRCEPDDPYSLASLPSPTHSIPHTASLSTMYGGVYVNNSTLVGNPTSIFTLPHPLTASSVHTSGSVGQHAPLIANQDLTSATSRPGMFKQTKNSLPQAAKTGAAAASDGFIGTAKRWTKHEDVRLVCCLLETDDTSPDGNTFLENIRGARRRSNLDRDESCIHSKIAEIFNDSTRQWSEYAISEHYEPYRKYNPCLMHQISIPRRPLDILKHFTTNVMDQVKAFVAAFRQSGRGRFDTWDFARWPVAHLI